MINKKILLIAWILLLISIVYASGVVVFGGNAYEDINDGLVLDIELTQDNYVLGTKTFADDSGDYIGVNI